MTEKKQKTKSSFGSLTLIQKVIVIGVGIGWYLVFKETTTGQEHSLTSLSLFLVFGAIFMGWVMPRMRKNYFLYVISALTVSSLIAILVGPLIYAFDAVNSGAGLYIFAPLIFFALYPLISARKKAE